MHETPRNLLNLKNAPLHSTFLRKIHICAFAMLIFSQFSEKIKKHVPRIPFSLSDLVFPLPGRRNTQKQDPLNKVGSGRFGVKN